jgi:hypothetical protein
VFKKERGFLPYSYDISSKWSMHAHVAKIDTRVMIAAYAGLSTQHMYTLMSRAIMLAIAAGMMKNVRKSTTAFQVNENIFFI